MGWSAVSSLTRSSTEGPPNSVQLMCDGTVLYVSGSGPDPSRVHRLSPNANGSYGTWADEGDLPWKHRGGPTVLTRDNDLYVFGSHPIGLAGGSGTDRTSRYVDASDTWEDTDVAFRNHQQGGTTWMTPDQRILSASLAGVREYNQDDDTYTQLLSTATGGRGEGGGSMGPDGKIVAIQSGNNAIDIYDPATNDARSINMTGQIVGADAVSWRYIVGNVGWSDQHGVDEVGACIYMPKIGKHVWVGGEAGEIFTWDGTTCRIEGQTPIDFDDPDNTRMGTISASHVGQTAQQLDTANTFSYVLTENDTSLGDRLSVFVQVGTDRWCRMTFTGATANGDGTFTTGNTVTLTGVNATIGDSTTAIVSGARVFRHLPPRNSAEGWAAILPNGNLIYRAGFIVKAGEFPAFNQFYQWDGTNEPTQIPSKPTTNGFANTYDGIGTILPTGELLYVFTHDAIQRWTPDGGYTIDDDTRPVIVNIAPIMQPGHTYRLEGRQLHGLHIGATWGDDYTMQCNHPIARFDNISTADVRYAKTWKWSSRSIAPNHPSTCLVTIPADMPLGTYDLEIVSAGVPSAPVRVTIANTEQRLGELGRIGGGALNIVDL